MLDPVFALGIAERFAGSGAAPPPVVVEDTGGGPDEEEFYRKKRRRELQIRELLAKKRKAEQAKREARRSAEIIETVAEDESLPIEAEQRIKQELAAARLKWFDEFKPIVASAMESAKVRALGMQGEMQRRRLAEMQQEEADIQQILALWLDWT